MWSFAFLRMACQFFLPLYCYISLPPLFHLSTFVRCLYHKCQSTFNYLRYLVEREMMRLIQENLLIVEKKILCSYRWEPVLKLEEKKTFFIFFISAFGIRFFRAFQDNFGYYLKKKKIFKKKMIIILIITSFLAVKTALDRPSPPQPWPSLKAKKKENCIKLVDIWVKVIEEEQNSGAVKDELIAGTVSTFHTVKVTVHEIFKAS